MLSVIGMSYSWDGGGVKKVQGGHLYRAFPFNKGSVLASRSEEPARVGPHFRLHPIVCGGDVWSWQPPTFYNIGS
jgi:hypothetical protein